MTDGTPQPAAPSATQSHGTVLVAVVAGFVLLLGLFWLSTRGVGPFPAELIHTSISGGTATVEVAVHNDGNRGGRANCQVRLVDADGTILLGGDRFLTARIPAKQSVRMTVDFPIEANAHVGSVAC